MYYSIKDAQFDLTKNSLKINTVQIDCPVKILQALSLFLQSDNKIITKDQLIKSLWGDLIVSDDSLFKVIQGLRKLFRENDLSGDVLLNIYGKGYKIKPAIIHHETIYRDVGDKVEVIKKNIALKLLIVFALIVVLVISTLLYYNYKNYNDIISNNSYEKYKEKIKLAPKEFLSIIDKELLDFNLTSEDRVKLNSLKGFAHFNQGQYQQTLEYYQKAIELSQEKPLLAIADDYLIMAFINLYKDNDKHLKKYLTLAKETYSLLNNNEGVIKSEYLGIEYLYLTHQYEKASTSAESLIKKAQKQHYVYGELLGRSALYRIHLLLDKPEKAQESIKQLLELALANGNGKFISYSYGSMAVNSMSQGDFSSAMKWANQTLKHAIAQPSTNDFQQGFSYIYNILSPLGHNELAEKYLQKAIDVQNHFNKEGHLHTAELNLGILKVKLKKNKQAKEIFSKLSSYKLSTVDRLATQAWTAINHYFSNDTISAYAIAKEAYTNKNSSNNIKLVAGIALMAASYDMERIEEGQSTFNALSSLVNPNNLIEYKLYLEMALHVSTNFDVATRTKIKNLQMKNNKRLEIIKNQTQVNKDILEELDAYLESILK